MVLLALWWTMRHRLRPPGAPAGASERMAVLLRFGLPTVPAEASVYALSIVDRYYIFHDRSQALAGLYSIAIKLAGAVAFIVRAFQYAWPPLAYSVTDDARPAGSTAWSPPTTCSSAAGWWPGWRCSAAGCCACWPRRRTSAPIKALPWVALGWAMYGLWVVFLVIAGRAKVTTRNFPASIAGLAANVILLLRPGAAARPRRRRHGAVRRLRGDADASCIC